MPRAFPAIIILTGGPNNELPGIGGTPEHPIVLPPGAPGEPSHPIVPGPVDPGYGLELPPVVTHPIPPLPGHPIELPPTYPVKPGQGLPRPPTVWPMPPRPVDPSYGIPGPPLAPELPIYLPPPAPNQDLPLQPGEVWPPLPPSVTGQILCFIWIVGVGYRWIVIDADLHPEHPIIPPSGVPEPEPEPEPQSK